MSQAGEPNGVDERDEAEELTELEYASSQRQLSQAENERLSQLRQRSKQIVEAVVQEEAVRPGPANPVVSGDDSP